MALLSPVKPNIETLRKPQTDADRRWIVSFVNGAIGHDDKTTGSYRVRAVRGGVTTPVAPAATMKTAAKLKKAAHTTA